jgi:hypothetical protein
MFRGGPKSQLGMLGHDIEHTILKILFEDGFANRMDGALREDIALDENSLGVSIN